MKPEKIKIIKAVEESYFTEKNISHPPGKRTREILGRLEKKIYPKGPEGFVFLDEATKVDKEFYNLANSIISGKNYALSIEEKNKIIAAILPLGKPLLKYFVDKGLKIRVVDSNKLPANWPKGKSPEDGTKVPASAYYDYETNEVVVIDDKLTKHIIIHEIGHALDDFLSDDKKSIFASNIKNTKFYELFQNYINRCKKAEYEHEKWRKGGKIGPEPKTNVKWSRYARVNEDEPCEYFADAFSFYLESDETRNILKNADPDIYNYFANGEYNQDFKDFLEPQTDK